MYNENEKRPLTIFTCSIFPELTSIWHLFHRKNINSTISELVIYDSSRRLDYSLFQNTKIIKHPNVEHGKKIDHFLHNHLTTDFLFVMDDDFFIPRPEYIEEALLKLSDDMNNAVYTYWPRHFWKMNINGRLHSPMGSYAIILKTEPIKNLKISFKTKQTLDPGIRNGTGYYDTADLAQEVLLKNNYKILYAKPEIRNGLAMLFGTSSGYVNIFRRNLFSGKLRLKKRFYDFVLKDDYSFQRTFNVAIIGELYDEIFNSKNSFHNLLTTEYLIEQVYKLDDEERKNEYLETVKRINSTIDQVRSYLQDR